jgi:5,10-methylenetetrahydrofolate reductase
MGLLQSIHDGWFGVVIEFSPKSAADVERIAGLAGGLGELNAKLEPHRIRVAALSLTQSPGGAPTLDALAALARLREKGWPDAIEVIPHVTGKDMNSEAIVSLLGGLAERGTGTVLALSGDLPSGKKKVFEVDSLGILQLVRQTNVKLLGGARSLAAFEAAPQLVAGAAVSPFKYTEGSLAMQYIKAGKKIREGAQFLVCQSGWDPRRSEQLLAALAADGVPILGNCLVTTEAAAKALRELPGCAITDAFLARLHGEPPRAALVRAGRQLAMFRGLGYAGVDLGRPGDFASVEEIETVLQRAVETSDWREHLDDLSFAPPQSPAPSASGPPVISRAVHDLALAEDGALYGVARAVLSPFNSSAERDGALYHLFRALEGFAKEIAYECQHCGDCFLPENDYVCTLGQCEKGLANPPCGDADPQGRCGNNVNRICVGEKIYTRMLARDALAELKVRVLPPRKAELQNTSSLLNYYFGRDHAARTRPATAAGLIQIGESLHATIPAPGAALAYLQKQGAQGFEHPNRGLIAIADLIRSQARQGADYVDINLDALNDADTPALMRRVVRLVDEHGEGVPPCVDSSSPDVLLAGLDEWRKLGRELRAPIANSIPYADSERYQALFELRRELRFGVVCLLVGATGPLGSADEMVAAAKEMHARARAAGFEGHELFFDCVTLSISTDGCVDAMGMTKASHTHNVFEAIRRIREDPALKGVHAVLGVSNWAFGVQRRRTGHIRAFLAAAQRRGLDASILDLKGQFGVKPPMPELVELVEMFAGLDGNEESLLTYAATMQKARAAQWL